MWKFSGVMLSGALLVGCEAGDPAARKIPTMDGFDTDHSGGVSIAEWIYADERSELFAIVDANGDGVINNEEFDAFAVLRKQRATTDSPASAGEVGMRSTPSEDELDTPRRKGQPAEEEQLPSLRRPAPEAPQAAQVRRPPVPH